MYTYPLFQMAIIQKPSRFVDSCDPRERLRINVELEKRAVDILVIDRVDKPSIH